MRSSIVVGVLLFFAGCSQPVPNPPVPRPRALVAALPALPLVSRVTQPWPPRVEPPCERVDGGSHLLPEDVRAVIQSTYRSWEVARHCRRDLEREQSYGLMTPSVAVGDFDGDGRSDLAVLLRARSGWPRTIIVAFLDTERGLTTVLAGDGLEVISTIPKGTLDYSYDDNRMITFQNDAIETSCCECCGDALIYRRGRFFRVTTADSRGGAFDDSYGSRG